MDNEPLKHIDHELLAKYFASETTLEEVDQVKQWISMSEENKKALDEAHTVWLDTGIVRPFEEISFDVDRAWNKFKRTNIESPKAAPKSYSSPYPQLRRIAALILIVVGVGLAYFFISRDDETLKTVTTSNELINVTLADNSGIQLNKNSSITYPESFDGDTREITLSGEAFFEVEHKPEQPFIVHIDEATVTVLGTSFNIESGENIIVSVVTGKVQFAVKQQEVILEAGMTGTYTENGIETKGSLAPDASYWRTKRLEFRGTPLLEVVDIINKHYNTSISLKNPNLISCNLTATFENETLDNILDVLSVTYDLEITQDVNTITLDGQGCD